MKRLTKFFSIGLSIAFGLSCLMACDPDNGESKSGIMRLVIASTIPQEYVIDLDNVGINDGALSILAYLNETEGLLYTVETSIYGAFLTKVGDLEQNEVAGAYLYIYTSVEQDFDVSVYATTITFDGVSLTSSGMGISEMTIEADCMIYIDVIVY